MPITQSQRMDFLWVRWLGQDVTYQSVSKAKHLLCVDFVPTDTPDPFRFLDSQIIIRVVHPIPAFAHGKTSELMGPSISRQPQENHKDWQAQGQQPLVTDITKEWEDLDDVVGDFNSPVTNTLPADSSNGTAQDADTQNDYRYYYVNNSSGDEAAGGEKDEDAEIDLGTEDGESHTDAQYDKPDYAEL
ncbi:hypothetical protein HWV62_42227 [Athelia sp. TMB]|nr:hypothetical protein HWV62_42227 [Athelia sp. TMB]